MDLGDPEPQAHSQTCRKASAEAAAFGGSVFSRHSNLPSFIQETGGCHEKGGGAECNKAWELRMNAQTTTR